MDYATMGEEEYAEVVGDELLGDEFATVGAARPRLVAPRRPMLRLPPKPGWRRTVSPGVPMPGQGQEPLPINPLTNDGVFTAAFPNIIFNARPQRPFRAERLLVIVRRSAGAGAPRILCSGIFIGTQLQQLQLGEFDIEFYSPTSFGVRLQLINSQPGIDIQLACRATPVVPADESVAVAMQFLGRSIR